MNLCKQRKEKEKKKVWMNRSKNKKTIINIILNTCSYNVLKVGFWCCIQQFFQSAKKLFKITNK